MKKLLLLLTISLVSITGLFAQLPWPDINVSWYIDSECTCNGTIDSVFSVTLKIDDIANGVEDVFNDMNWEPGSTDNSDFSSVDVQYYCNEINHEYTPNFTLYATVTMYCKNLSLLQECYGRKTVTNKSCLDFANGSANVENVEVTQ